MSFRADSHTLPLLPTNSFANKQLSDRDGDEKRSSSPIVPPSSYHTSSSSSSSSYSFGSGSSSLSSTTSYSPSPTQIVLTTPPLSLASVNGNEWRFRPLVSSPSLARFSFTYTYYLLVLLMPLEQIMEQIVQVELQNDRGDDGYLKPNFLWYLSTPVLIYCLGMMVIEGTRVDRKLLKALLRSFEFWYVLSNAILWMTFDIWLNNVMDRRPWWSLTNRAVTLLAVLYCLLIDSMVQMDRRWKLTIQLLIFVAMFAGALGTRLQGQPEYQICVFWCGSMASLRESARLQILIFFGKACVHAIRYPNQLMRLNQNIEIRTEKREERGIQSAQPSSPGTL